MRPSFPTAGGSPLVTVRSLARTAFAGLLVLAAVLAGALGRPAAAAEAMPYGQGLLWKIQPAGNVAPSYLFGTIHITDQRVLDLAPPVRSAFEQSQSAVFEVIMT
ncbi:MAG TPA: TraB/GumN family protein, partial [Kiloniellales bacterium]|nr:TraB/GumN family protein [Kiloniellales bacterium]